MSEPTFYRCIFFRCTYSTQNWRDLDEHYHNVHEDADPGEESD